MLAKTYGDFFLILRGLTKTIKYISDDKLAASMYLVFGDIMKRNNVRLLDYIKNETHQERFIPRLQMFVGNKQGGTRFMYIDSDDSLQAENTRKIRNNVNNLKTTNIQPFKRLMRPRPVTVPTVIPPRSTF